MKEQKKEKCKIPNSKGKMQSSGVTLIALIITIIILLILAMTSVALIMRWNIIEKTEMAAEGYQGVSEKDAIELGYDEYALDKTTGKENPNLTVDGAEVEKKDEDGEGGWTVKFPSGNVYTVNENGNITGPTTGDDVGNGGMVGDQPGEETSKDTGALGEAKNPDNYGKVVDFKSKGQEQADLVWRIFYEDENNVYLISEKKGENGDKEYPITSLGLTGKISSYPNGTSVSTQGQDLMPMARDNGDVFIEKNTNDNIRATAYLCDTSKNGPWEDYLDEGGKAAWAMGGPTIELFAKSYNAAQETNKIELSISNRGYTENTASDWFSTELKNGIYRLKTSGYWWLASPSRGYNYYMHDVNDNAGDFSGYEVSYSCGARPVVCIPRSNFDGFKLSNQ